MKCVICGGAGAVSRLRKIPGGTWRCRDTMGCLKRQSKKQKTPNKRAQWKRGSR